MAPTGPSLEADGQALYEQAPCSARKSEIFVMALPIRQQPVRAFIRHPPALAEAGCSIVTAILYRFLENRRSGALPAGNDGGQSTQAKRDEEMLARTLSRASISRRIPECGSNGVRVQTWSSQRGMNGL